MFCLVLFLLLCYLKIGIRHIIRHICRCNVEFFNRSLYTLQAAYKIMFSIVGVLSCENAYIINFVLVNE